MSSNTSKMVEVLRAAIESNLLTVDELHQLRQMADSAIARKMTNASMLPSPEGRRQFLEQIIRLGLEKRLPASPEHLMAAGEYIYDADILGRSPDQIIQEHQPRKNSQSNKG